MAPKNSRTKGHNFERAICRDLREWLGDEWRVQRNLDDDQTGSRGRAGDILVDGGPHPWPFAIEAKTGYGLRSSHLWKGSATLEAMWAQARSQADAVALDPMLVVKPAETGHPTLVMMPPGCRRRLRVPDVTMKMHIGGEVVAVMLWHRLMEVAPAALLECAMWHADRHATPAEVAAEVSEALRAGWGWLTGGEE